MKKIILSLLCMSFVAMGLRAPGYENRLVKIIDFNGQVHHFNGQEHEKRIQNFEDLTDCALVFKNEQLGEKNMPYFIYGSDGDRGENMSLVQNDNGFLRALSCGGWFMLSRKKMKDIPEKSKESRKVRGPKKPRLVRMASSII